MVYSKKQILNCLLAGLILAGCSVPPAQTTQLSKDQLPTNKIQITITKELAAPTSTTTLVAPSAPTITP